MNCVTFTADSPAMKNNQRIQGVFGAKIFVFFCFKRLLSQTKPVLSYLGKQNGVTEILALDHPIAVAGFR
jgi:hypothetical protein